MVRDESNSAEAHGNSSDLKEMQCLKPPLVILHGGCSLAESYAQFLPVYPHTIKMEQACSIHPPEYNSAQEFCAFV